MSIPMDGNENVPPARSKQPSGAVQWRTDEQNGGGMVVSWAEPYGADLAP